MEMTLSILCVEFHHSKPIKDVGEAAIPASGSAFPVEARRVSRPWAKMPKTGKYQ